MPQSHSHSPLGEVPPTSAIRAESSTSLPSPGTERTSSSGAGALVNHSQVGGPIRPREAHIAGLASTPSLEISGAAHSVGRSTAPGALPQGSWTATPTLPECTLVERFGTMGVTQAGNRGHSPAAADLPLRVVRAGDAGAGGATSLPPPGGTFHPRDAGSVSETNAPGKGHEIDAGAAWRDTPRGDGCDASENKLHRAGEAPAGQASPGRPQQSLAGSTPAASILSLIEAHRADCIRRGNRPNTMKDHEYGYSSLLALGATVEDINRGSLAALLRHWREQGMSDSQINRRIANMKLVTKWAAGFAIDRLPADPLADLHKEKVSRVKKDKRTFSLEEARAIIKATEGTDWHLPFIMYLSIGIRSRVLMLTEGRDWDSARRILTLRVMEGNKVAREQYMPVGSAASQAIESRGAAVRDPLFPSIQGGVRSPKAPYNALQRACRAASKAHPDNPVPPGGCHAMRRCTATEIARMQGSSVASLVLGHMDGQKKTLAETHYIQATAEDAREAVQAMEDALLDRRSHD